MGRFELYFNFTNTPASIIIKTKKNIVKIQGAIYMSFTSEKRDQIKKYILEKIGDGQKDVAKRASEAFNVSLNTIYRYIRELEKAEIISKNARTYTFVEDTKIFVLTRTDGQLDEEDIIYAKYIKKYIEKLPDNVKQIWQYSFMEMMNNAIDHSQAEKVFILIAQNYMNTTIAIYDEGIGIFKKIKDYYNYDSLDDAVNELFKGKLTTDTKNHSGEGIFFTSRILDDFLALSDGKIFSHNKYEDIAQDIKEIDSLKEWANQRGTVIFMRLSNYSKKVLKEVFDMFADIDGGFIKTRIPIKNIYETYPVSRSQAKRLYNRFDKFQEIELDFSGIEEIGQGFAHELFVVFTREHPNVKLSPLNISKEVEKMINHVKNGN